MLDLSFAQSRFGLGRRGDSAPETVADPPGWVLSQIGSLGPLPGTSATRATVASALQEYREERRAAKSAVAEMQPTIATLPMVRPAELKMAALEQRDIYVQLVGARVNATLTTSAPFMERMAHFWANHFAVSAQKQTTIGFAGLLEADAIRPNVAGRFGDMQLAVVGADWLVRWPGKSPVISASGPSLAVPTRKIRSRNRPVGFKCNLTR